MLICLLFLKGLCGNEEEHLRYDLSVCAVFKEESPYLKEWIEYHLLVGVDHFYIYNNLSKGSFREKLLPYIKTGRVSLIDWPDALGAIHDGNLLAWLLGVQIPAYENAVHFKALHETKWLVFINADDFLVPIEGWSLKELLHQYDDYPGITLPSDCFQVSQSYPAGYNQLLIENYELTEFPLENSLKQISKKIFKPKLCEGFLWSPYECLFKDNQQAVRLKNREMRINHYVDRSEESLFMRKPRFKLSIDNRLISDQQLNELLKEGFDIEDQYRHIDRFIPALSKKMY